ncbi:MAG: Gfo/Idh/MocA family oxidoreductase [bacterium]|nr:Gfo/Idh/MocA family oxidoreductase [Candidatus Kapabacteria bacterium]
MSIRIGIVGCGAIAREHAHALSILAGVELFAYADIVEANAKAMRDEFGGVIATTDAALLIADDRVDVVYICTWHDTHAPLVERAAAARKSVVLEKPLAITREDCIRIHDAVERSGILLMTAFKLRFYPMVERARAFITQPIMSVAQVMDSRWPDDFWAQLPSVGGGNILSQGPHAMDMLYHLHRSEPETVYAEGGAFTHGDDHIDNIVATIRFANGSIASVAQGDSSTAPLVSKFSFQMFDGSRSVHLHDRLKSATFLDGGKTITERDRHELGMLEENRAFIAALAGQAPPPTTHIDGLRATSMVLAAIESVRTGVSQRVEAFA